MLGEMRAAGCLVLLLCGSAFAQQTSGNETLKRAVAAHQRGDLTHAVEDYRAVLEMHPEWTKVRVNLAAALGEAGRLDEAITVLDAAPARDRGDAAVLQGLALAQYRKDDLPAAAANLEKLITARPGDVNASSMLADCYLRLREPGKALALIEPVSAAHPENAELSYQYGMALIRAGRPGDGLVQLETAGKRGKSADAYLLAGATALDLAQFQRARDDLENAVRLNPKIPGAWTWTGMARDRVSDEDGAKQAFRNALELNPQDFEANLHLGAVLYRERELAAAKPYLERAVAIEPSSSLARYALALVWSATGEGEKAVRDLETVTQAAPEWVEPHVKLASLYFRLHRAEDGQREREIVDKLKNEHRDQKVPLPELEKP